MMMDSAVKRDVTAVLHHKEIAKDCRRTSKLEPYEDLYNWKGLEFPVLLRNIDKFEKNNPAIAVNVLFNNKKSSDLNTKCR